MKEVEIWTDGSALKAPDGTFYCGCGVVMKYGDKIKKISESCGYATVNIAELKAPIIGLSQLKERCLVTIYSDSAYTINSQCVWYNGWEKRGWKTQNGEDVKNKELIQRLKALSDKHIVKWVKVKGHSGDYYNDLADELACKASAEFKEGELLL